MPGRDTLWGGAKACPTAWLPGRELQVFSGEIGVGEGEGGVVVAGSSPGWAGRPGMPGVGRVGVSGAVGEYGRERQGGDLGNKEVLGTV